MVQFTNITKAFHCLYMKGEIVCKMKAINDSGCILSVNLFNHMKLKVT